MENQEIAESFLALLIEKGAVKTAIWAIEAGKTRLISYGEKETWDGETLEDLISGIDLSLAAAVSKLETAEKEPPKKVILGLGSDWLSEGKILPEKLAWLKKISQELSLTLLGFVAESEAQAHYLKTNEGVATNAILIGLEAVTIKITLVLLGKVVGVETVGRSDNLALDVVEGLLRFPQDVSLPARIILYGEGDLEAEKQNLLSYPWQEPEKKLPFLHFPRVESGPENFELLSLCLAGGAELGKTEQLVEAPRPEEAEEKGEEVDLGFVEEKDILAQKGAEPEQFKETPREEPQSQLPPTPKANPIFGLIKKIPRPLLPSFSLNLPLFLIFLVVILTLAAVGFYALGSFAQAKITLFVTPQDFSKEFNLTISPTASAMDEKTKIIPGELMAVQVSESKTGQTTGKKLVGEKAKGEVTIYNRTDGRKTFPAGAVLIGPGQLKFTLDAETSVASKTPDLASGVDRWGEAKANLTAGDIGAAANVAANSQFTLLNLPTLAYLAKNTEAFAGGSSRQIQAVAEKDQADLLKELTGSLTEKAKTELRAKVKEGRSLIEESLAVKATKKEFDRQVGEESQTLSLNLALTASALTFEENTLRGFSEKLVSGQNLALRWEEAKTEFKAQKINSDQSVLFGVSLAGKLYPKIDQQEVAKNLAGRSREFGRNYLSSLPRVSALEIKISPGFFNRLDKFPSRWGNIKVEVVAK